MSIMTEITVELDGNKFQANFGRSVAKLLDYKYSEEVVEINREDYAAYELLIKISCFEPCGSFARAIFNTIVTAYNMDEGDKLTVSIRIIS